MLTATEISRLENCLLDDHVLIELELIVTTEESAALRERFNDGECLNSSELISMPFSEPLAQVKVKDAGDVKWLTEYAIANGRDLQSLFGNEDFNYLSLFIEKEKVSQQFASLLSKYNNYHDFNFDDEAFITVSFPVSY